MSKSNKGQRVLSLVLFFIGVSIGLIFASATVWANLEASLFEADMPGDANLRIKCPIVITTREIGTVSGTFTNTADWDVNLTVKTYISQGRISFPRQEIERLELIPGQTGQVKLTVTPDKLVYGRFIFIKMANQRLSPIPGRVGTCGILVVNVPILTGSAIVILAFVLTILSMGFGYFLWQRALHASAVNSSTSGQRAMTWLAVFVALALVCGVTRAWLPGVVVILISLLLIIELFRHNSQG